MARGMVKSDQIEQQFPLPCTTRSPYIEVVPWCEQHVGAFGLDWYRYGSDIAGVLGWDPYDTYRFRREQDAIMFRLRWS
jgi:hypothetical protein